MILPARFNEWLKLDSPLFLREGFPLTLPTSFEVDTTMAPGSPEAVDDIGYKNVFEERKKLIDMRNNVLDSYLLIR